MSTEINTGTYRIRSVLTGFLAVGVDYEVYGPQVVRLNGPIQEWFVRKDDDGRYHMSVSGYVFTSVVDGKVTASSESDEVWEIRYETVPEGYTVRRESALSEAWTVHEDDGQIHITKVDGFPTKSQLFLFESYSN